VGVISYVLKYLIDSLFPTVPVVKKTWGEQAALLEYYSDYADPSIPTINLGVPNTERGECSNLFSYLVYS